MFGSVWLCSTVFNSVQSCPVEFDIVELSFIMFENVTNFSIVFK